MWVISARVLLSFKVGLLVCIFTSVNEGPKNPQETFKDKSDSRDGWYSISLATVHSAFLPFYSFLQRGTDRILVWWWRAFLHEQTDFDTNLLMDYSPGTHMDTHTHTRARSHARTLEDVTKLSAMRSGTCEHKKITIKEAGSRKQGTGGWDSAEGQWSATMSSAHAGGHTLSEWVSE